MFGESRAEEARQLTTGSVLYAPRLFTYELTNVGWRKALRTPELRDDILHRLERGLALDIRLRDVSHPAVFRVALATDLTTYDASYLHLSRALGIPLLTFDRRLAAAVAR